MTIVPRVHVKLEPKPAARALAGALAGAAKRPPPLELVRVLLAMIWFETGGAPANGNPGNLMAASLVGGREVSTWRGPAWRPPFYELTVSSSPGDIASHAAMLAGKEPTAFRAYQGPNGLEAGLADYLTLLAHRFPKMLTAAASGDLGAFSESYVRDGYCPRCSPGNVERNIRARLAQLEAAGAFVGLDVAPPPGVGEAGPAVLLVAATVAGVLLWLSTRKAAA